MKKPHLCGKLNICAKVRDKVKFSNLKLIVKPNFHVAIITGMAPYSHTQ